MVLRKITIVNSGRYVPKNDQTSEIKQNTRKNNSPPEETKQKNSQNNKKILKNVAAQGFGFLIRTMNCYF